MKRKSEFMKKGMSAFLAAVTVITSMGLGNVEVNASTTESSSLQESFGLKKNVQDGVILHAWDWSFNNIKDSITISLLYENYAYWHSSLSHNLYHLIYYLS